MKITATITLEDSTSTKDFEAMGIPSPTEYLTIVYKNAFINLLDIIGEKGVNGTVEVVVEDNTKEGAANEQ